MPRLWHPNLVTRTRYASSRLYTFTTKQNGADPDGWVGAGSESQASMRATLRPTLR